MKSLGIRMCQLALPFVVTSATATPSLANDVRPQVAVPVATTDISGCWSADRELYGSYHLSFCLGHGSGNYTVTGGGLDCQAAIAWRKGWFGYSFALNRSYCGGGTDWSGDTFNCSLEPAFDVYGNTGADPYVLKPKVAVPVGPGTDRYVLSCHYQPAVAGWGPQDFTAFRS